MERSEIERLEGLARAATPGEWRVEGRSIRHGKGVGYILSHGENDVRDGPSGYVGRLEPMFSVGDVLEANAAFIAAANPQTILSLTQALRESREALEPFAKLADMVGDAWTDETPAFTGADGISISIGQLRRASTALRTGGGE